ncbi:MAG: hypothetical protein AW12_00738 [Candidatus Accumulibacter sp. BA-94]|nr:MAG: hypothetical protein AW12_00738 [Candidatus Accumulibacter sp. BA-94]
MAAGRLGDADPLVQLSDLLGVGIDGRDTVPDLAVEAVVHLCELRADRLIAGAQALRTGDQGLAARQVGRVRGHLRDAVEKTLQCRRKTGTGVSQQVVDLPDPRRVAVQLADAGLRLIHLLGEKAAVDPLDGRDRDALADKPTSRHLARIGTLNDPLARVSGSVGVGNVVLGRLQPVLGCQQAADTCTKDS